MRKLLCFVAALMLLATIRPGDSVGAQSFGALSFGPIAPNLAGCPAGSPSNTTLCTVANGSSYSIYASFNGSAYAPLVPPPAPPGVTSLNGKTGALSIVNSAVTTVSTSVQ